MMNISMVDSCKVETRIQLPRRPDAVDQASNFSKDRAQAGSLRRRGIAAVERDHHAGQQNDEGQHARQQRGCRAPSASLAQQLGLRPVRSPSAWRAEFPSELPHRVDREQCDQQERRPNRRQEQLASDCSAATYRGHGDRGRQQDAAVLPRPHSAGRPNSRAAHFRDAGGADRRARRRRRTGHGCEQRAGKISDAGPPGSRCIQACSAP